MYTKEQTSAIKESFWKTFGRYMSLHLSADGMKINWINYKTGIRHLFFRMEAGNDTACIMIEIAHPDTGVQELMFDQFKELKALLEDTLQEAWQWQLHINTGQGKTVSRISTCTSVVNIFRQEDWPAFISFFKPRLIALDEFWSTAQYQFDIFK